MSIPSATKLVCLLAAALIATQVFPNAASAQTLFSDFSTHWKGDGTFQTDPHSPVRQAWCRVRVTPVPAAKSVNVKARCGSGLLSTRFTMQIEDRGRHRIAAGVYSPILPETAQYLGALDGKVIRLVSRQPVVLARLNYQSTIIVKLSGDGSLNIEETVVPFNGGNEHKIASIAFSRYTPWFAGLE